MGSPLIALLPGALTIYLGFSSGGYFPTATGVACAVLAIALVLRITLAEHPFEGFGLAAAAGAALIALLAVWTIASSAWSDAPGRAVLEFNRVLLYGLAFMLMASLPRTRATARWLLAGLGAGGAVVCIAGLLTRVLPETFAVELPVLPQRLSHPITYWNGLGLLAALALVACVHFASAEREHPALRVGAAALLPLLATTLYFTFSRASIAVAIVAIVAYMLIARPRGLLAGAVAGLPATLVALKFAYDADLLAARDPTTAAAVDQGQELSLILVACVAAAAAIRFALIRASVDRRLANLEIARRTRRIAAAAAAGTVLVAIAGSWIAFDLGDRIDRQYDRFREGDSLGRPLDARERLTQVGNNGRLDHWDVAIDAWKTDKLKGTGAGTYELTWASRRPVEFTVRDGHSLYLEALSELGVVSLLLLGGLLALMLLALALRARGPDRPLWTALLVLTGAWAVHAAQDWVWELPAVTLAAFTAGAIALAQPPRRQGLPRLARIVAALLVLSLAVTPVLGAVSHVHLKDSVSAFKRGDCDRAIDSALASTSALSAPAQPYAILGFCDAQLGELDLAERMMRDAVKRDPNNWIYRYGLALVLGAAAKDPRPAIATARSLNPLDGLLIRTERAFDTDDPRTWKRRALAARLPID